jgi:actin-like ATPase involved in cell morphogenesis
MYDSGVCPRRSRPGNPDHRGPPSSEGGRREPEIRLPEISDHPLGSAPSEEEALKAKVSTWESFFSLFAGARSELSLYIPTDRPAEVDDLLAILLFTPDGNSFPLDCRVAHMFYDAGGQQMGVGVTVENLQPGQEARFQALVDEATRRVDRGVRVRETLELEPETGAPISVEDEAPLPRDRIARTPERPPPEPLGARLPRDSGLEPVVGQRRGRRETRPTGPAAPVGFQSPDTPDPVPDGQPVPPRRRRYSTAGIHPVPVVGMDFGTTHSSVAVYRDEMVSVVQAQSGLWDIPSVVGFTEGGEAVVGTEARELLIIDPAHAIASPKRLLGRLYTQREVVSFLSGLAIAYSEGADGQVLLHPRGETYTVGQVCAPVLFSLRLMAQEYLQQEVRHVVLTAPVSFDEDRRRALAQAASLAGLQVLDIVDEPVAAALAHHFDSDYRDLVAVYDFGGGTFDFTLVRVAPDGLEVVATAGDTWLGGDDFDLALASAAANDFWRQHQLEIRHQVVRWQRLLVAAEKAKRELSLREETVLGMPDAALTAKGPLSLHFPVSRPQFAAMIQELVERTLDTCREALSQAGVNPEQVNATYLCGGTSCIPAVRDAVSAFFGKPAKSSLPPERAVVTGAALFAAQTAATSLITG